MLGPLGQTGASADQDELAKPFTQKAAAGERGFSCRIAVLYTLKAADPTSSTLNPI